MLNKGAITTIIAETALWWAAHWHAPDKSDRRSAPMVPGGGSRLDELVVSYGLDLWDLYDIRQWKRFQKELAILSSQMRFRIFANREDAVQAALNVTSTLLERADFRLRNDRTWNEFEDEYQRLLRTPLDYDRLLIKCIRGFFSH